MHAAPVESEPAAPLGRLLCHRSAPGLIEICMDQLATAATPKVVVATVPAVEVDLDMVGPRRPDKQRRTMPSTIGNGRFVLMLPEAGPTLPAGMVAIGVEAVARVNLQQLGTDQPGPPRVGIGRHCR